MCPTRVGFFSNSAGGFASEFHRATYRLFSNAPTQLIPDGRQSNLFPRTPRTITWNRTFLGREIHSSVRAPHDKLFFKILAAKARSWVGQASRLSHRASRPVTPFTGNRHTFLRTR